MPETIKRRVPVEVTERLIEMRDYTFPVYSRYWSYLSMIYIRTNADLSYSEVSIQDAGYTDDGSPHDEMASVEFGKGSDWLPVGKASGVKESSAEEFAEAVARARAMLDRAAAE